LFCSSLTADLITPPLPPLPSSELAHVVPVERDHRVQAQRHQLQAQIHGEKAVGRDHDHHAQHAKQTEHEKLAAQLSLLAEKVARDRKSTRLNSSHVSTSYDFFFL